MKWIHLRWNQFWFEPTSGIDLAVCRILFFGGMFGHYFSEDFSAWNRVSPMHWQPIDLFTLFRLEPTPAIAWLQVVWKGSLLSAAVGWKTRWSSLVAFILGIYLIGLPHNFGKVDHYDAIFVVALGVMSIARSGDRLSVDSRGKGSKGSMSAEYRWPIQLVCVMMVFMYVASGLSKLRHSGVAWFGSEYLATVFFNHAYRHQAASSIGPYLAQYPSLLFLMSVGTIIVELGMAGALFSRTLRFVMVPAAYALHVSIFLLMGPRFLALAIVFVFWVPWNDWLYSRVSGRSAGQNPLTCGRPNVH